MTMIVPTVAVYRFAVTALFKRAKNATTGIRTTPIHVPPIVSVQFVVMASSKRG